MLDNDQQLQPFEKPSQGVKQVIVVRKDLNMRKGKLAAQVAHASMGIIIKGCIHKTRFVCDAEDSDTIHTWLLTATQDSPLERWLNGPFAKIVVFVNSKQELLNLEMQCRTTGILHYLIIDSGKTEFNGVPTETCLAIGPDWTERVDTLTGGLPLL